MLTAGLESIPPIILLHGSCSNSAFWFPDVESYNPIPGLPEDAKRTGIKKILASISSENAEPKVSPKNGFVECGRFEKIGEKFESSAI